MSEVCYGLLSLPLDAQVRKLQVPYDHDDDDDAFKIKKNHIAVIALCDTMKEKRERYWLERRRTNKQKKKPKQNQTNKKATDGLFGVLDASIPAELPPD